MTKMEVGALGATAAGLGTYVPGRELLGGEGGGPGWGEPSSCPEL